MIAVTRHLVLALVGYVGALLVFTHGPVADHVVIDLAIRGSVLIAGFYLLAVEGMDLFRHFSGNADLCPAHSAELVEHEEASV